MEEKLEKVLNGGKRLLVGAGLVGLLGVSGVMGCGSEDGNGGYSGGSKYYCDCKGEGFFATMEVYADSGSGAESWATNTCREDYSVVGCSCDCRKANLDCIYCGEEKSGGVLLHDEWCPDGMDCASTTGGVICVPEGVTEYICGEGRKKVN